MKQTAQKSRCSKTKQKVYVNDSFATPYKFMLPDGKERMTTGKGCFLTVLLFVFLLFYGTMQLVKLLIFDETDVMVSSRDSFFKADEVFSRNLMYAFGITDYDANDQPIEDPTYGLLLPFYKSWGLTEGDQVIDFEPLPTRDCTVAELHIHNETDPNSQFYQPHPNSVTDLSFYYKKLKCLDVDKVEV